MTEPVPDVEPEQQPEPGTAAYDVDVVRRQNDDALWYGAPPFRGRP